MENDNKIENLNEANENNNVNQSDNNENDLILGKFKSVDDLADAYKNIQSQSGQQSKELGELRKKAEIFDNLQKQITESGSKIQEARNYFSQVVPKYSNDEYFKNNEFTNLYKEAFSALGVNLDTDKFITLLDKYVNSRINLYEKNKSAKSENEYIKNQMKFSESAPKNIQSSIPKLDNLSNEEIDAYVAKHI